MEFGLIVAKGRPLTWFCECKPAQL